MQAMAIFRSRVGIRQTRATGLGLGLVALLVLQLRGESRHQPVFLFGIARRHRTQGFSPRSRVFP